MTITVDFLVFPGIQLLDLAGPYEVFVSLPNCTRKACSPRARIRAMARL